MRNSIIPKLTFLAIAASLLPQVALADDVFWIYRVKFDAANPAQGVIQNVVSQASTPQGQAILSAAAAYLGVDPTYVAIGTAVLAANSSKKGQETNIGYNFPANTSYCRFKGKYEHNQSGSSCDVKVWPQAIGFYAHTPKGEGGAGTWCALGLEFVVVRSDMRDKYLNNGVCKPADKVLLDCKGKTCSGGPD